MDLVGYAASWGREMDAVSGACCLKIPVVIGIFAVCLKDVVIHVLGCQFHIDRIEPEGFKFQHGHGSRGILKQSMVNLDTDFLSGNESAIDHVVFYDLLSEVFSHSPFLPFETPSYLNPRPVWMQAVFHKTCYNPNPLFGTIFFQGRQTE